jgi:ankyrin repeat protein
MTVLPLAERQKAIRIFAATRNRDGLRSVQLPIDEDLEQAVLNDEYEAAKAALEAGACADVTEIEHFHSVMMWAIYNNNPNMVALLIAHDANVNAEDQDGNPLLYEAVSADAPNVEIVQQLLNAGANVMREDACGYPAHFWAGIRNSTEVLELLRVGGADLQWRDYQGQDALMHAAESGSSEAVAYLLAHGSDPTRTDDSDMTAAELAREEGHEELAVLLETHKARL